MVNPKVLIAAPIAGTKQYSINLWFEFIANQDYKNYDICVCSNGEDMDKLDAMIKEVKITDIHNQEKKIINLTLPNSQPLSVIQRITYGRERIRRYAVKNNYDYLFFLDTDTIPVVKNTIQELIDKDKDVITGLYCYKGTQQPIVIDKDTHTNINIKKCFNAVKKKELLEVDSFGFGCLMLSKKVIAKCAFDYEIFGEERSDDFGYCFVMEQQGFKKYFYPYIFCRHIAPPDFNQAKHLPFSLQFKKREKNIKLPITSNNNEEGENKIGGTTKVKRMD